MKKVISILCMLFILCTSSAAAFAAEYNPANDTKQFSAKSAEELQKRSEQLAKRLDFFQFRKSLDGKRDSIRQNRTENRELAAENTQLRKDIVDTLLAIKENGGTLPAEIEAQLKAYNQEIKDIKEALKETKGDIREILTVNKQNIKDMNYEAVNAAFGQVEAIQQNRAVQLARINEILKSMKALLSTIR